MEQFFDFYKLLIDRETYCVKKMGEQYRCDTGKINSSPGFRDYGSLIINRDNQSQLNKTIQARGGFKPYSS